MAWTRCIPSLGDPLEVSVTTQTEVLRIACIATDPLSDIAAGIAATAEFSDADVVVAGSTGTLEAAFFAPGVNNITISFIGGVDEGDIEVEVNFDDKEVTFTYNEIDTFGTIMDFLDGMERVSIPVRSYVLIYGTNREALPEEPGWSRAFRGAGGSGGVVDEAGIARHLAPINP